MLYVCITQNSSGQVLGTYSVAHFNEYPSRAPVDRSKWKIVAVESRPFPEEMRESLSVTANAIHGTATATATLALMLLAMAGRSVWRRRFTH